MKILHVSPGLQETCGVSQFVVNIARAQQIAGHTVVIVTTMTCGYPVEGLDVRLMPDPTKVDFTPEVVHIHTLWGFYTHKMAVWCRRHHLPYVISPHGALTKWALAYKWWKKLPALALYQYRDLKRAAGFHVTSEREREDFRRLRLSQPIAVAPLGIWLSDVAQPNYWATRSDPFRDVVFVGRIHPIKNLDGLLRAWALARQDFSAATVTTIPWRPRLIIAGSNDVGHQEELVALAKELGLTAVNFSQDLEFGKKQALGGGEVPVETFQKRLADCTADVVFTGPVYAAAKDWMFRHAWVSVLPSHTENFGGVVVESLAQGTPAIASMGTPWEIFELETPVAAISSQASNRTIKRSGVSLHRCGWWVAATIDGILVGLRRGLSMSMSERGEMGMRAKALAEDLYSWRSSAATVMVLYSQLSEDKLLNKDF